MAAMSWDHLRDLLVQGDFDTRAHDPQGAWSPVVDLYETSDHYVLLAELAGLTIEDLDIQVRHDSVTLSGRRPPPFVKPENYLRVERGHGTFSRTFAFPHAIDAAAVSADLREGVLTVMLPKARVSEPRRVAIT